MITKLFSILFIFFIAISQGIAQNNNSTYNAPHLTPSEPLSDTVLLNKLSNQQAKAKRVIQDELYHFTDVPISIKNGHGEYKTILFSTEISKRVWQDLKKDGATDHQIMNFIAKGLSMIAQSKLENQLSFDPLKRQFFTESERKIICYYATMARNGYGNLSETEVSVTFDPFEKD